MLTGTIPRTTCQKRNQYQVTGPSHVISRLLSAAVINKGFRDLLLSDPARALAQGYYGEEFSLDFDQKALVFSIQAESLSEFARQLTSTRKDRATGGSGEWIPVNQPAFALHAK